MAATHYLHGIRLAGRKSKYSAYYRADPVFGLKSPLTVVVDAERINVNGVSRSCTEAEKEELLLYRMNAKPY